MRHILIVDDALDLGRLLKTALSLIDSTMPIVVVPSGEEALLEGARYPLDLLITDVRLPGISGVELVQKIRKHHPDVSIIVITGMSDEQVRQDVKRLEVDYFFTKPLSMPEFTDAARRCLKLGEEAGPALAPAASIEAEVAPAEDQLTGVIAGLRSRLDAAAVLLVNERARVEAAAGTLPTGVGEETFARLLAAANAGLNVPGISRESGAEVVHTYRGAVGDFVCLPVDRFLLLVALQPGASNLRLALSLEETLAAHANLKRILARLGLLLPLDLPVSVEPNLPAAATGPGQPQDTPASPEDVQAFEAIFKRERPADVDVFWEEAALDSAGLEAADPEALTYDQAAQLGLTPDPDGQAG